MSAARGAASKPIVRRKPARAVDNLSAEPELNERFREALHLMNDTSENLFITGKAGTGKSTLLAHFCRTTEKHPVVLAPTGVAALNVKGQTIHRFFNFYVDVTPDAIRKKSKIRNPKLFKKLKCIVIDEVSMVRADLLDCIDTFLRLHGPRPGRMFGGVQMIFVGDLYQLPPVVGMKEREIFESHYATPYFFSAHVFRDYPVKLVELDKVYRQKDQTFIDLLNNIRNNRVKPRDLELINSRVVKNVEGNSKDFTITLTTTNAVADGINDSHLAALKGKLLTSTGSTLDIFDREYLPTALELNYKIGAQIMLLNNDSEQRWVNGSIGVIEAVKEDEAGTEYLAVRLRDDGDIVSVYPFTWDAFRFGVEGNEITAAPAGSFTQYPFRLAWAVTIHKSQGKTFEKVVVDIGRGAFAAGQIYVALSRCTSFAGVQLKTPIRAQDIRTDSRIFAFLAEHRDASAEPDEPDLITQIQQAIDAGRLLDITYRKSDDTLTESRLRPLKVGPATYQGQSYDGMKAFCLTDEVERTYRIDRILALRVAR